MAQGRVTIGALPDGVLLDIFEYHISLVRSTFPDRAWYPLVHVCQRWRYIIFASPRRLGLYLYCKDSTPVREKLEIWPPLPIVVSSRSPYPGDNIIAALEHPDRVREISFWKLHSPLDRVVTMMQESFPKLESLHIAVNIHLQDDVVVQELPSTFLGGSAPCLRSLHLEAIQFPALPRLLLSCDDLRDLDLCHIIHPDYIPPEVVVTSIYALTRLSSLSISFDPPDSFPGWITQCQRPPPVTRVILPALTAFWFTGASEYLEDLVARIDAPLLKVFSITFFNHHVIRIHTQQLGQFISQTPILMSCTKANMNFTTTDIDITCWSIEQDRLNYRYLRLNTLSYASLGGVQDPSMAQICSQLSFLMSRIERLDIQGPSRVLETFQVNMDSTQWLELFHSFPAVQTLYLCYPFGSPIMLALQGLNNEVSVTDISLPALVDLHLEVFQETEQDLQDIIAARQRSGHPVTVHHLTINR